LGLITVGSSGATIGNFNTATAAFIGSISSASTGSLTIGNGLDAEPITMLGTNNSAQTTIIAASATLSVGPAGGLGPAASPDNGTLSLASALPMTVSNTISGTGGLTKSGIGTATLAVQNFYSGTTTLSGGYLSVSADNNLGTAPGSATPAS